MMFLNDLGDDARERLVKNQWDKIWVIALVHGKTEIWKWDESSIRRQFDDEEELELFVSEMIEDGNIIWDDRENGYVNVWN